MAWKVDYKAGEQLCVASPNVTSFVINEGIAFDDVKVSSKSLFLLINYSLFISVG